MAYVPSAPLQAHEQAAAQLGQAGSKLQALLRASVRQTTEVPGSVAAATTLLGGMLRQRGRAAPTPLAVLDTDRSGGWARQPALATGDPTADIGLDRLALYLMQAAYALRVRNPAVDVVHLGRVDAASRDSLVHVLSKMGQPHDFSFVLLNFLQSDYLKRGDPFGHFGVVGAYDAQRQRALVLDAGCLPKQPYWVPLGILLAGMQATDPLTGEPRGYLVVRSG
jgi:hypothetical protein